MKRALLAISAILWIIMLRAQTFSSSVLSSGGFHGVSANHIVDATIGQAIVIQGNNGSIISDGFQQGYLANQADSARIAIDVIGFTTVFVGDTIKLIATSEKIVQKTHWEIEGIAPYAISQGLLQAVCYTKPGIYDIKLKAEYADGTIDTITKENFIKVVGIIQRDSTINKGDSILLSVNDTTLEYLWNTGATTHQFFAKPSKSAVFSVSLINRNTASYAKDSTTVYVTQTVDTATIHKIINLKKIHYSLYDTIDLFTELIKLNYNEIISTANFSWHTSTQTVLIKGIDYTEKNGRFCFNKDFADSLYCTISDTIHENVRLKTNNIHVCAALPHFVVESGCSPHMISDFYNTSRFAVKCKWFFGDGSYSTDINPVHTIVNNTDTKIEYPIRLQAISEVGCSRYKDTTIFIYKTPIVNFGLKQGAPFVDEYMEFENLSDTFQIGVKSFEWKHAGAKIATTYTTHIASFADTNTYDVSLSVKLNNGCHALKTYSYKIDTLPFMQLSDTAGKFLCDGDEIELSITNYKYFDINWYNGNQKIESGKVPTITVNKSGIYWAELIGTNLVHRTDSIKVEYTILPNPEIFKHSDKDSICLGSTIELQTWKAPNATTLWFGDTLKIAENTNSISVSESGTYQVCFIAGNCVKKSELLKIKVIDMPLVPDVKKMQNTENKCMGEIITLQAKNEESFHYQWFYNNSPLKNDTLASLTGILSPGFYVLRSTNYFCYSESQKIEIAYEPTEQEIPKIGYLGPQLWYLACNIDNAKEYKWYYNNEEIIEANNYYYEAGNNLGTYMVAINNGEKCFTFSSPLTIPDETYFATEIINANTSDATVSFYPNPSDGIFMMNFSSEYTGEIIVEIYNALGVRTYYDKMLKKDISFSQKINLLPISSNIYNIYVYANNTVMWHKIIITE